MKMEKKKKAIIFVMYVCLPACLSVCLSVCPSLPMKQFGFEWADFHEILLSLENLSRKFKFHF